MEAQPRKYPISAFESCVLGLGPLSFPLPVKGAVSPVPKNVDEGLDRPSNVCRQFIPGLGYTFQLGVYVAAVTAEHTKCMLASPLQRLDSMQRNTRGDCPMGSRTPMVPPAESGASVTRLKSFTITWLRRSGRCFSADEPVTVMECSTYLNAFRSAASSEWGDK